MTIFLIAFNFQLINLSIKNPAKISAGFFKTFEAFILKNPSAKKTEFKNNDSIILEETGNKAWGFRIHLKPIIYIDIIRHNGVVIKMLFMLMQRRKVYNFGCIYKFVSEYKNWLCYPLNYLLSDFSNATITSN